MNGSLGPISVAVCNFDGEEHLPPCLTALLDQTRAVDEIVVVDNASSDRSRELVRERWPDVRLEALTENAGPSRARNRGLELARNPWVLLVDNDAVLASDALERLERAALAADDSVCVLQPRSVFADDPSRVHYDGGALHYVGLFSLRNFFRPLAEAEGEGVVPVRGAVSVALLVRRDVLLELGGFDEAFFILFEDLDLSMRIGLAGRTMLSVEEAICHHRGGTAGISYRGPIDYPRRRAFLHSRNRWIFLVKNYRWRTLALALPGLLAYELVWALFTLRSGTFLAYVRGKWAFAAGLGETLRERSRVQALRRVDDRELLVGGPLTVAPQLERGGAAALVLRTLDALLAGWWALVRGLAG